MNMERCSITWVYKNAILLWSSENDSKMNEYDSYLRGQSSCSMLTPGCTNHCVTAMMISNTVCPEQATISLSYVSFVFYCSMFLPCMLPELFGFLILVGFGDRIPFVCAISVSDGIFRFPSETNRPTAFQPSAWSCCICCEASHFFSSLL